MLAVLLLILYLLLGFLIATTILSDERVLVRVWAGGVIGTVLLMWSNIPFSFLWGFTIPSHLAGLGVSIVLTFVIVFANARHYRKNGVKYSLSRLIFGSRDSKILVSEVVFFLIFALFMAFSIICLFNHYYPDADGNIYTGQCTYGDMNFHLSIITSIKEQGTFPPEYSICPGNQLNYYFLSDSISSSLYLFGMSLRYAYLVPMVLGFALVFMGFWLLGVKVTKNGAKATTAFILFFMNGGLGIIYFLDNLKSDKSNFTRIFTTYYNTPTNYVNSQSSAAEVSTNANIRWTNTVIDMMLPQRATLFGWMLLLLVIFLLYKAVLERSILEPVSHLAKICESPEEAARSEHARGEWKFLLAAGVLAGLAPMVQTYTYFTIGLIAIVLIVYSLIRDKFAFKRIGNWLFFGIPALALSIPQLVIWIFGAVGGDSFLKFNFNAYNESDNWLWFWVKNVGLVFVLFIPALIHAHKELRVLGIAGTLIFVITEFVQFQTFTYDNNKLYLMWYLLATYVVAEFLVDCFDKLKGIKGRTIIAIILFVLVTISASMTYIREIYSGMRPQSYCLYSKKDIEASDWIKENTEPDSLFLSNDDHNNTIACLSGRNIFVGSGTFLWSHDVDYRDRANALYSLYNDPTKFEMYRESYGFDYVYISSSERNSYGGTTDSFIDDYLVERYKLVYDHDGVQIYDVR